MKNFKFMVAVAGLTFAGLNSMNIFADQITCPNYNDAYDATQGMTSGEIPKLSDAISTWFLNNGPLPQADAWIIELAGIVDQEGRRAGVYCNASPMPGGPNIKGVFNKVYKTCTINGQPLPEGLLMVAPNTPVICNN